MPCVGSKPSLSCCSRIQLHCLQAYLMHEMDVLPRFFLAALATWRITHLLANEDGPADLVARFRAGLGSSWLGKLLDCFYCLSLWIAAPMALFVSSQLLDWLLAWLALSGAACLLERITEKPAIIRTLPQIYEGETSHGLLRPETGTTEARAENEIRND